MGCTRDYSVVFANREDNSHVIIPSVSMDIYFIVRSKAEHYFIFHCNAQT